MNQSRRQAQIRQNLTMGDFNFEKVDHFVYLAVNIVKNCNEKDKVQQSYGNEK